MCTCLVVLNMSSVDSYSLALAVLPRAKGVVPIAAAMIWEWSSLIQRGLLELEDRGVPINDLGLRAVHQRCVNRLLIQPDDDRSLRILVDVLAVMGQLLEESGEC